MPSISGRGAGLTTGSEGVWGFAATSIAGHLFTHDQRIMFVNPNYTTATDTGNTGEDPLFPFATIAAALARCRAGYGDTIFVAQNDGWQYGTGSNNPIQEEIDINVQGVRLIGLAPGYGVAWESQNVGTPCITISAMDAHVEGFAFAGAAAGGVGIYAIWDGLTNYGENFVVKNCSFDDNMDTGIQMEYTWYCEIANCIFQECDTFGIYVDPAGSGAAYANIHDCIFKDCGAAMSVNGLDDSWVHNNAIYNANAQGAGVATDEGIDTTGGANNLVFDNHFSCLLPVPANGDWDDLNTGAATDAWVGNYCQDGLAVTTPT